MKYHCGFAAFIEFTSSFSKQQVSLDLIRALLDKFWDTTNTFHFSWGELALTPMEFGAVSGLRMVGKEITVPGGPFGDGNELIGAAYPRLISLIKRHRLRHAAIRTCLED